MKNSVASESDSECSCENLVASVEQMADSGPVGRHSPRFSFPIPGGLEIDTSGWLGDSLRRPGAGDPYGLDDPELDRELRAAQETHDQQVRKGDVRKLLERMVEESPGPGSMGIDWSVETLESDLRDLATAVRNRGRQDLDGLLADVLSETASTIGLVVLRGHRVLQRRLALQDRNVRQNPDVWLSAEVRETLLPALIEMSLQFAELQRLMAATKRQNELAEARRQQNQRPENRTKGPCNRSGSAKTRKKKPRKR